MSVRYCSELGENLQIIIQRLCANQDLLKLLYFSDKDPLGHEDIDSEVIQKEIQNKLVKVIPVVGPSTGWLTAVACGKGKDPRVAIAWDVFRSSYEDPIVDANAMSKSDTAYIQKTLKGDIACEVGMFNTSGGEEIERYEMTIRRAVAKGEDISSLTQSYKDLINAAIKFTMKSK